MKKQRNNDKRNADTLRSFLNAMASKPYSGIEEAAEAAGLGRWSIYNWLRQSADAEKADDKARWWIEWLGKEAFWHRHVALAREISILEIDNRVREMALVGTTELMFNNQTGAPVWETDSKIASDAMTLNDDLWEICYGERKRSDVFKRDKSGALIQARKQVPPNPQLLIKTISALMPKVYGERVAHDHNITVGGVLRLGSAAPKSLAAPPVDADFKLIEDKSEEAPKNVLAVSERAASIEQFEKTFGGKRLTECVLFYDEGVLMPPAPGIKIVANSSRHKLYSEAGIEVETIEAGDYVNADFQHQPGMLDRVHVDQFRRENGVWTPYLKDGRQVHSVAQPGAQEAFLAMLEREGLFAGPRGSGKTKTLIECFAQFIGHGYGEALKGIVLRASLNGFDEFMALCRDLFIPIWGDSAQYNKNNHRWTWSSGESLQIAHFGEEGDAQRYLGQSFPIVLWEELTAFANDSFYKNMLATNRSAHGVPLMVRSTTNPGGVGHNWVRMRFAPPEPESGHILGNRIVVEGIDRRAIVSTMYENQRLLSVDHSYRDMIRAAAKDASMEAAWLNGSWNITAGGLFDAAFLECGESFILPDIPVQKIPQGWTIKSGFDWGESEPWACLWIAISDGTPITLDDKTHFRFRRGDILVFDELYGMEDGRPNEGLRLTVSEVKEAIIARENETGLRYHDGNQWRYQVRRGVADSQIFVQRVTAHDAESIYDTFEAQHRYNGHIQRGLRWEPAEKPAGSRATGWAAIRNHLYATKGLRDRPGLFITKRCEHTLRTLKDLPRDLKKPDDCPRGSEDHCGDTLRYLLTIKHTPAISSRRVA